MIANQNLEFLILPLLVGLDVGDGGSNGSTFGSAEAGNDHAKVVALVEAVIAGNGVGSGGNLMKRKMMLAACVLRMLSTYGARREVGGGGSAKFCCTVCSLGEVGPSTHATACKVNMKVTHQQKVRLEGGQLKYQCISYMGSESTRLF